ncbi:MAG TPA: helix-hairpin-helix domain-containing protein [Flavisolibacter sp.]|nr:helix-hairpin-helix domain-containing protein [Flavisolibacter sp.]
MNKFVKDYLTFSKRDRIGIISLIFLIIIIYFLPLFFAKPAAFPIKNDSTLLKSINNFNRQSESRPDSKNDAITFSYKDKNHKSSSTYKNGALFIFNPNTLPPEGWEKLGLEEKTIKTLIHFREKGGKFYKREDLKKIWGLPLGFFERVKEFIDIPANAEFIKNDFKIKERKSLDIDINLADSNAFIALPGIGIKLSARIINFRNKLGGFYSVDQVSETYGLPDSTFQTIKHYLHVKDYRLKKVNINAASLGDLKGHPYIKWNIANAIISYRTQHGSFSQLDDLKKISIITEAIFTKMAPYLIIQ